MSISYPDRYKNITNDNNVLIKMTYQKNIFLNILSLVFTVFVEYLKIMYIFI